PMREGIEDERNEEEGEAPYSEIIEQGVETFKKLLNLSEKKTKSFSYLKKEYEEIKKLFTKQENKFVSGMLDVIGKASRLKAPWRQYDQTGVMEFLEENDGWDDRLYPENLLAITLGEEHELDDMYYEYTFNNG